MPPTDDVEDWHRGLVEASPVPVVVYDRSGVLQYVNEAAVEFVNADGPGEVVGRRATEFVHPDDRERIAGRIERLFEERESVPPTEATFVALDDEEKHAVTAGAPVSYEGDPAGQAVLNDITERKHRERQLRRERDRFEMLFENLPSAVVYGVAKDEKPIIRRVNRRFEEVFGYDREQVIGENLDEYIVPDEARGEAKRLNQRILSEGRARTEVERRTDDGRRQFLLDIVMDDLEEDRPEGYAIYTDITEKKRTERELERQNERLKEFVSVVAHDLRNPLNVARAHARILEEEASDEYEAVGRIVRAHDRMERIIDDLLALARQGETIDDPEPVDVETVATGAWETVRTADADLRVDETRGVLADPTRLRELFENLFRNAIEHGGEDVRVELGAVDGGFYVADDGPGIPAEERDQVFESGYTTAEDGTGFGLSIVRRIAEAHGWSIALAEAEDGGARFEITGVEPVHD